MMHRLDDRGQLQLLESIMVAVFIFVAIAVVSIYRLPTNQGTFQQSELENLGLDSLKVRLAKPPEAGDDCNESPCPFATDLDRILSLALGYIGPTVAINGEDPDSSELQDFFNQSMPAGSRWIFFFSNGHNLTQIAPLDLTPPSLPIGGARALVEPNWTVHRVGLNTSVLLRVDEMTGFGSNVDKIYDPLNRTKNEFGLDLTTLFPTRVPLNVTYGTYKICFSGGPPCRYFTVVPNGVYDAGSQILGSDRYASPSVETLATCGVGTWTDCAKYNDTGGAGLDSGDGIYIDVTTAPAGKVTPGDLRLSRIENCRNGAACPPGSFVRSTDIDGDGTRSLTSLAAYPLTFRDKVDDNQYGEGEGLYLDVDSSGTINTGDRRISRAGHWPMGSTVAATDLDGDAVEARSFTGADIVFYDLDEGGGSDLDPEEPVFLNVDGSGQSTALEPLDLHLSRVGAPTLRYAYDVKLVVWYGL